MALGLPASIPRSPWDTKLTGISTGEAKFWRSICRLYSASTIYPPLNTGRAVIHWDPGPITLPLFEQCSLNAIPATALTREELHFRSRYTPDPWSHPQTLSQYEWQNRIEYEGQVNVLPIWPHISLPWRLLSCSCTPLLLLPVSIHRATLLALTVRYVCSLYKVDCTWSHLFESQCRALSSQLFQGTTLLTI